MQRKEGRSPARDQVGKPKTRPWLEPPIELATTDVVSVPPDVAAPHTATPSWSNFEIVNSAKILAPPRLPEFRDPASSGMKVIAWHRVSARVMAVASARTTWVVAGAVTILAAAVWLGVPLAAAVRTPNAPEAAREVRNVAIPSNRIDPNVPAAAPAPENSPAAIPEEKQERTQVSSRLPKLAPAKSPPAETAPHASNPVPSRPPAEPTEPSAPRVAPAASPSILDVDTAGEFDRNAAMQALRQAGDTSRPCFAGAGSGNARVAVTFARSGGVSEVVIDPPLAGTPSGNCVATKFRGLRVPPFRGSSMTVRKTIAF